MNPLEKLKEELRNIEERFIEKDGQSLSAILDPSKIPTDMAALASIEHGNVETPGNEQLGKDEKPSDAPNEPGDKEPTDEPTDSDDVEKDIKDMTSEEVKESLDLAIDIAFECVEKAQMILKALTGSDAKADLKEVVDEKMVSRANDVVEEYIDFVEYLEEISADEGSEDDEEPEEEEPGEGESEKEPEEKPSDATGDGEAEGQDKENQDEE